MKLTLLGREVREDAVQRATVRQVVQRSRAVGYEQHLVASACEKVRVKSSRNAAGQRRFSKVHSPSIDSSLAGVA